MQFSSWKTYNKKSADKTIKNSKETVLKNDFNSAGFIVFYLRSS